MAERLYFADSKRDDMGSGGFTQQPSYKMPELQSQPTMQPDPGDGFFPLTEDDDDLPF